MIATFTVDLDGAHEWSHCLSLVKNSIGPRTYDAEREVWMINAAKFVAISWSNLANVVSYGAQVWDDTGRDWTETELRETAKAQQAIDTIGMNAHQHRTSTEAQIAAADAAREMLAAL